MSRARSVRPKVKARLKALRRRFCTLRTSLYNQRQPCEWLPNVKGTRFLMGERIPRTAE